MLMQILEPTKTLLVVTASNSFSNPLHIYSILHHSNDSERADEVLKSYLIDDGISPVIYYTC